MINDILDKFEDFGARHPHLATIAVILGFIGFVALNFWLYMWPMIILVGLCAGGLIYGSLFSTFKEKGAGTDD